jgi:hypothetical protein
MKTFQTFFKIAACCCLLQVVSCTKTFDESNDSLSVETDNDASLLEKKCQIVSFTQDNIPAGSGTRTVDVYYNRHGDIDSMIADVQTGSLGLERFYFTYGKNHKLIGYREDAGESYFYVEQHTYAYEQGRIVRDSLRISDATFTEVRSLEYDSQGRIIKENRKIVNDDGTVSNLNPLIYSYDDDGNLVDGSASYDDGVNFLRTSEQLMFTQRDYSRNNRAQATAYNERNLPLGFAEGVPAPHSPSYLFSFGLPATITYDCK